MIPPSFLRKNPSGGAPFFSSSYPPARYPSAAMGSVVKKEAVDAEPLPDPVEGPQPQPQPQPPPTPLAVIDLSSSDDSDSDDGEGGGDVSMWFLEKKPRPLDGAVDAGGPLKKIKSEDGVGFVLPLGFLDPLPLEDACLPPTPLPLTSMVRPLAPEVKGSRQFWKAGDYEGDAMTESASLSAGIEHVRVHPKFLHSNATSHKWALGAIAELLDNAVDEVCNGATFVNVDVLANKKDMSKLLLVEDNGGGMNPDKMRQCMSLGYSAKSKSANTIGQYGNGFKTSTMRLGADVIVFSRCHGKGGKSSMQSIGMLSYTFLRDTGKEDIVVPMIDYEKRGENWNKLVRSSTDDWNKNLETIMQWSPYSSEDELLHQFGSMTAQGTRIIIYNLWEDDQLQLELDFVSDTYDIQARGVNRDEKKIQMANQFPNSRHFLTYRHSLRSYASILYLRLPQDFKMILRGKEIEHHNIVNDMMIKQEVTYKPQSSSGTPRDPNMVAIVTIGFVKDAKDHIDVQGFNVYHKNRLIKPFWKVWNTAGSGGRGVIGVLEANFVEPAHDKQDFERTTVLARLETRLVQMQKDYWGKHCHLVGYVGQQTRKKLPNDKSDGEISPEAVLQPSPRIAKHSIQFQASSEKGHRSLAELNRMEDGKCANGHITSAVKSEMKSVKISGKKLSNSQEIHNQTYPGDKSDSNFDNIIYEQTLNASNGSTTSASSGPPATTSHAKETSVTCNGNEHKLQNADVVTYEQLKYVNHELKDRLKKLEEQRKSLAEKLSETEKKMEEASREQEALIDIFSEERSRRDMEEENLRKKLKEASDTIQQLLEKSYNRSNTRT